MDRELSILNGGDLVSLNGFTKTFVLNTILGMLRALHDVDVDLEIRIIIPAASRPGATLTGKAERT